MIMCVMDVLETILDSIDNLTDIIIKTKRSDSLQYIYDIYITKCININFDSKYFFLTRCEDELGWEINTDMKPRLLKLIKNLIQTRSMGENIKNSCNRIQFRVFKHNVLLDAKENQIRKEILLEYTKNKGYDKSLQFLLQKRIDRLNDRLSLEKDSDEWCENEVFIYRLEKIISTIQEHKARTFQT